MVKNIHGGTGHKKNKNKPTMAVRKIEDIAKNPNPAEFESYGVIVKPMGNRRFMVSCQELGDPGLLRELNCSLRGAYRKNVCAGEYVLIKIFDFNTKQGIIIDAYREGEVDSIKRAGLWDFPDDGLKKDIAATPSAPDMTDSDSESDQETSEIETIAEVVKQVNLPDEFDIDAI